MLMGSRTGPIPGLLCVPCCRWLQIVSIRWSASGLTGTVSASCSVAALLSDVTVYRPVVQCVIDIF